MWQMNKLLARHYRAGSTARKFMDAYVEPTNMMYERLLETDLMRIILSTESTLLVPIEQQAQS
jgi:hypothetical protein